MDSIQAGYRSFGHCVQADLLSRHLSDLVGGLDPLNDCAGMGT